MESSLPLQRSGQDVDLIGSIPRLLPFDKRPTVGIISRGVGEWIWTAKSVGLTVAWVWASDEMSLPEWLRPEVPNTLMSTKRELLTPVDMILCESKPPMWLSDWKLTSLVLSTRREASSLKPVWSTRIKQHHQDLGGLTTKTVTLRILSSVQRDWNQPSVPIRLPTSVYSVVSDTVEVGRRSDPPKQINLEPPYKVHEISSGVFHGGGLYHLDHAARRKPQFILRSVLHGGWCKRRLLEVEEWSVKDVPVRIYHLAKAHSGADLGRMWTEMLPGRCLEYGLRQVLEGIGVVAGGRVSKTLLRHQAEQKDEGSLMLDTVEEDDETLEMNDQSPENAKIAGESEANRGISTINETEEWSSDEEVDVKATKSDDAKVHSQKWNQEIYRTMNLDSSEERDQALDGFRNWMLNWYKRRTMKRYFDWRLNGLERMKVDGLSECVKTPDGAKYEWTLGGLSKYKQWHRSIHKGHAKESEAALDAISRVANSTWWEWNDGSRCMHWLWPEWYRETIRDGLKVWFNKRPARWRQPQKGGKTPAEHEFMKKKLKKVRDLRYVAPGPVESLTSFFAVPKGEDDIRMVYDGTKSGLNDSIWVPSFPLPTVDTMLRAVTYDTVMSDFDIGDCFLNFVLHETMQELCGIDLSEYFGNGGLLWERWVRAAMGLKSSPYQAVQAIMVAKEVVLGDRMDTKNAFRWDDVVLNLPGSASYDPSLPWVYKIRLSDGKIAADLFIYVDDGRITACNKLECKIATRQATSRLNGLGIQEAARKRRWGSRVPGAWAGSIVKPDPESVNVLVSQDKWNKTKAYVREIHQELKESKDGKLCHKPLERKRGFLIYVTRTYPSMVPYLKGIHLTLDAWRPGRDEDGWRIMDWVGPSAESSNLKVPERVPIVSRLMDDLVALIMLTESKTPPLRRIRSKKVVRIYYGFGDASAVGFCSTFQKFTRD